VPRRSADIRNCFFRLRLAYLARLAYRIALRPDVDYPDYVIMSSVRYSPKVPSTDVTQMDDALLKEMRTFQTQS
jgi:hypothetical protein